MHYETIKSFYVNSNNVPSFGISFVAGAISGSVSQKLKFLTVLKNGDIDTIDISLNTNFKHFN